MLCAVSLLFQTWMCCQKDYEVRRDRSEDHRAQSLGVAFGNKAVDEAARVYPQLGPAE